MRGLASSDRLGVKRREALPPVHRNRSIDDRATVNAFPGIEDEEEVREPLQHHQAFALCTFHDILLRVGRAEASAVQVAMDLLHHLDGLQGIANRGLGELCGVRGVGLAKAAQLKAALELGKRALTTPLSTGTRIGSSRDLFDYYYPRLRDLRHEVFKIILLDAKHDIIRDATVSEESLTLSIVHPRPVTRGTRGQQAFDRPMIGPVGSVLV